MRPNCSFGWNLESLGHRGLPRLLRSSEAVPLKSLQPGGGSPGLGDVTCHGHDWRIDWRPVSSVRGNADFRAVVRTSEPLAHKPLGAGSSVLSSKDFRPQLEQRHVMIATDNMSVVSYINHQGGVRSNKQRISCYVRTVTFSQSEQRTSPVFWTQGGHAFEEGDSSRRVEVAPWVSSDDLDSLRAARWICCATSVRMHIACCSSPCLTPRWRGTPRTGRTSFGSWTGQSCWWHRPGWSPSGRICYLRWAARGGTRTRSCGAFMCGCFGDIRGAECILYCLSACQYLHAMCILRDNWPVIWLAWADRTSGKVGRKEFP